MLQKTIGTAASANELLTGLFKQHGLLLLTGPSMGVIHSFVKSVMKRPGDWVPLSSPVNGDGMAAISNAKLMYGVTPDIGTLFAKKVASVKNQKGGAVVWLNYHPAMNETKLAAKAALFMKHFAKELGFTVAAMSDPESMKIEKISLLGLSVAEGSELASLIGDSFESPVLQNEPVNGQNASEAPIEAKSEKD